MVKASVLVVFSLVGVSLVSLTPSATAESECTNKYQFGPVDLLRECGSYAGEDQCYYVMVFEEATVYAAAAETCTFDEPLCITLGVVNAGPASVEAANICYTEGDEASVEVLRQSVARVITEHPDVCLSNLNAEEYCVVESIPDDLPNPIPSECPEGPAPTPFYCIYILEPGDRPADFCNGIRDFTGDDRPEVWFCSFQEGGPDDDVRDVGVCAGSSLVWYNPCIWYRQSGASYLCNSVSGCTEIR